MPKKSKPAASTDTPALPKYHTKQTKQEATSSRGTVPSAWRIGRTALQMLGRNWKLFAGISLIYALLTIVLVQGLGSMSTVGSVKDMASQSAGAFVGNLLAFSVQYHPEAAAGPHDARYLFDRFVDVMTARASRAEAR